MRRRLGTTLAMAVLLVAAGCSQGDKERARERAAEARRKADEAAAKARVEADKLARDARREAHDLNRNINDAVNGSGTPRGDQSGASEKLKAAGSEAGVKLDRAALITKVKAKLANDVGLSTVTSVDVDASGQVVTLRGTVSSPEQKHQAEIAAGQVSGVTRVINDLQVQP